MLHCNSNLLHGTKGEGGESTERTISITLQTLDLVLLHVAPVDLSVNVKTLRIRLLFLDGASIEPENNLDLEHLQYSSLFSSINTIKNGQNLIRIIVLGQFLPCFYSSTNAETSRKFLRLVSRLCSNRYADSSPHLKKSIFFILDFFQHWSGGGPFWTFPPFLAIFFFEGSPAMQLLVLSKIIFDSFD